MYSAPVKKGYVELPLVDPLAADVSFKDDILPILVPNCESCHQIGKVFPELILSAEKSYNQLLFDGINAPYVDTIAPKESMLYIRIKYDMPQFGLLSQKKIGMILNWIEQGAKNN